VLAFGVIAHWTRAVGSRDRERHDAGKSVFRSHPLDADDYLADT
jgi:hypothetical protein